MHTEKIPVRITVVLGEGMRSVKCELTPTCSCQALYVQTTDSVEESETEQGKFSPAVAETIAR